MFPVISKTMSELHLFIFLIFKRGSPLLIVSRPVSPSFLCAINSFSSSTSPLDRNEVEIF